MESERQRYEELQEELDRHRNQMAVLEHRAREQQAVGWDRQYCPLVVTDCLQKRLKSQLRLLHIVELPRWVRQSCLDLIQQHLVLVRALKLIFQEAGHLPSHQDVVRLPLVVPQCLQTLVEVAS